MKFTEAYCNGAGKGQKAPKWIKWILIADAVQILANLLTKHAFDIEWIVQKGQIYYVLKPLAGQYIHRVVVYGVFIAVILVLTVTTIRTSRLYRERYSIMLISMTDRLFGNDFEVNGINSYEELLSEMLDPSFVESYTIKELRQFGQVAFKTSCPFFLIINGDKMPLVCLPVCENSNLFEPQVH